MGAESPDGRFILYHVNEVLRGEPGRLRVFDTVTRETHSLGVDGIEGRWSPAGERVAFTAYSPQGTALHIWTLPVDPLTGRPTGPARRAALRMGRGASWSPDGSTIAFTALPPTDTVAPRVVLIPARGGRERVLVRATGWAHSIRWAPDGESIYYRYVEKLSTPPRLLARVRLDGGPPEHLTPFGDLIGFSPGGRFLAYHPLSEDSGSSGPRVRIATPEGEDLVTVPLPLPLLNLRWRSKGLRMFGATRSLRWSAHSLDVHTGDQRVLTDSLGGWAARWSPDMARVAWISAEDRSVVVSPAGGGPTRTLVSGGDRIRRLRWSPDGRHIAYTSGGGRELRVVPLAGGGPVTLASAAAIWSPRWTEDGEAIQYVAVDDSGAPRFIHRVDLSGTSELRARLPAEIGPRSIVAIGDDSLAIARDGPRVLAIPLGGAGPRVLYTAPAGVLVNDWLDLSPDGRWAAISTFAAQAGVWEPEVVLAERTGASRRRIPLPGIANPEGLRWHPDGRHLVIPASPNDAGDRLDFFLVPISGGPPRSLSIRDAPDSDGSGFSISPDGSLITFTVAETGDVTIWELDLEPILEALAAGAGALP